MLSNGRKPVYLIVSEEPYFLDKVMQTLQNQFIPPEARDFNLAVMHARDTGVLGLLDLAREYPFLSDRRLIIAREAQEVKDWEPLISYLSQPNPASLLVLLFSGKPDGRMAWVKKAKELAQYTELKALSDSQVSGFVTSLAKEKGLSLEVDAVELLVDYIGNDPGAIDNEFDKLAIVASKGKRISRDDVTRFSGLSREFNVFELQRALAKRDRANIYRIASNMANQTKVSPLVMTVGALFRYFHKIWFAKIYARSPDDELSKLLGLTNRYFIREYREAAAIYPISSIEKAFEILKTIDQRGKGMDTGAAGEGDLYLEMALQLSRLPYE